MLEEITSVIKYLKDQVDEKIIKGVSEWFCYTEGNPLQLEHIYDNLGFLGDTASSKDVLDGIY